MNGRKAKSMRALVYGSEDYRKRKYTNSRGEEEKFRGYTYSPSPQIFADSLRRKYQKEKKKRRKNESTFI